MNFYSKFTSNKNSNLQTIENALSSLKKKLSELNIATLNISDYNKKYIGEHIKDFQKTAWFLSHIFLLVNEQKKDFKDLTIIDYGGGSGILSFLAKELGIGTVIYNDIYDVSCEDVKILAAELNIKLDHIVAGDVNDVAAYISKTNLRVDFVIAHDVIEHIYDVKEWYLHLKTMLHVNSEIICTSHANEYNILIRRKLRKLQINAERNTRVKQWGHKERDSLDSFYEIRKQIIAQHSSKLSVKEVEKLAKTTRGLIKIDIIKVIDAYIVDGKITYRPNHITNTCDPITGNWVEQFINLKKLNFELSTFGYNNKIRPGYYINSKGNILIKFLKTVTNYKIHAFNKLGLYLAPYYVFSSKLNKV